MIQKLCKFCGTQSVFAVFIEKLKTNVAKAQQNPTITNWSAIECVITCISELTYNGQFHDVKALQDVIFLVYQLPKEYVALTRAGANLFRSLSKIMKPHGMDAQQDLKKFIDFTIGGF